MGDLCAIRVPMGDLYANLTEAASEREIEVFRHQW